MKKLFLLIIASWATSCLPAPDAQRSSALKFADKNKILTETNEELKKEVILNNSFDRGALTVMAGMTAPICYAALPFLSITVPIVMVVGFGTIATCSFVQECYGISKDDKTKTTGKERAFAHVKGMGSVCATIFLFRLAQYMGEPKKRGAGRRLVYKTQSGAGVIDTAKVVKGGSNDPLASSG